MKLAAAGAFKNIKNKIDVSPENRRASQLLIVPLDTQGQQTNSEESVEKNSLKWMMWKSLPSSSQH